MKEKYKFCQVKKKYKCEKCMKNSEKKVSSTITPK